VRPCCAPHLRDPWPVDPPPWFRRSSWPFRWRRAAAVKQTLQQEGDLGGRQGWVAPEARGVRRVQGAQLPCRSSLRDPETLR
jgi:hypothetical protein